jgi:hypothetical protein
MTRFNLKCSWFRLPVLFQKSPDSSLNPMRKHTIALLLLFISFVSLFLDRPNPAQPIAAAQSNVPAPEDVLGFRPGDDRKLASWAKVVEYFEKLDAASDRVKFEELGKSTMGAPFVMATISAPENLARLDDYKKIQELLADPRKLGNLGIRDRKAADLLARGKTIVLITCGIHSDEVGSYLSSMLIAHRLASSNEPEIQNILRNTIILLVPSLNPDGVDIVKNWYDKTLGTPYEGTDPPELYHKYTGHDDNRDWYAFTQVETQITVDKIHNVWHPEIVHDIHQQGEYGSRLFLPPYMQPVEPNVPKQIVAGYTELGTFMAQGMRAAGFKGVTTNSTYDAWSPSRAYSHYHGGVRILSETASCKIATPINIKFDELRPGQNYDPRKETANFGPIWHGGEWHLRDITTNMTTAAFLLLRHASQNREQWLRRFYEIGKEAVRPRRKGELWGYAILPPAQGSYYLEARLEGILGRAGVEVKNSLHGQAFTVNGVTYPEGTQLISLAQPFSNFARAVLERQHYPDLRDPSGHPIPPYDVTAHTLPLLMNVNVRQIPAPFQYSKSRNEGFGWGASAAASREGAPPTKALYQSSVPSSDEGWTRWVLETENRPFLTARDREIRGGNLIGRFTSIIIPDQPARTILNGYRVGTMPPEYTGGLGPEGVKALQTFVEDGGTLVCLNRASDFAIEQFKLPLKDVVAGLPRTEFYVPGSILRIELDTTHPIVKGMPKESIAWAEDSPVFEVLTTGSQFSVPASNVHVIGWYSPVKDPLLSGWLLGGSRIKGKAALVEVTMGKGRIVLFGFRPQYRAQSLATYPLLFNALSGG